MEEAERRGPGCVGGGKEDGKGAGSEAIATEAKGTLGRAHPGALPEHPRQERWRC